MASNGGLFQPCGSSTVGQTVALATTASIASVSSTVTCTNDIAPAMLITNNGPALVFARVSKEASPVATTADLPIPATSSRIIVNPAPSGVVGVAVIPVTATACTVYFTPGIGFVTL